jgi:Glycosyl hydrolase family 63 C-terminal domain
MNAEQSRLQESKAGKADWRLWGPYLSERQWGTVREDYSPYGTAWEYLSHDDARRRAYRWGEDGIAGISDKTQKLCFSLALWNGKDPILKERLFGLTNSEGNHGEDVKELYYYLDATPSHSYLKYLYKYLHAAYPYQWLIDENRRRGKQASEFELIETGLFDEDRYFDVFVEYAKAAPDDIMILITVCNRGPDEAALHVIPQLWFRNTWSWSGIERPSIHIDSGGELIAGDYRLYADGAPNWMFCDNESNFRATWPEEPGFFKDGFHEYVVRGNKNAINPAHEGSKAAAHYAHLIGAGASLEFRLRLRHGASIDQPFAAFDSTFAVRRSEADAFYNDVQIKISDPDLKLVQRQAFAGMIWNKQFYRFNVCKWLDGDPAQPPPPEQRKEGRDSDWRHVDARQIISMPDKWEFPWFASWDLAFQTIPFALIDPEFAKEQLLLLTHERYMHPNGQLPAYEWAFGDTNPPVQAWAALRVYKISPDRSFLERIFHKLLLNFSWWVNKKDVQGRNIFQGGFLGLDNVGVFDRSAPLPTGGLIDQADGTSWMAMYSLNLMHIGLELARDNPDYQEIAVKFFEHFLYISAAMINIGGKGIELWSEADGFYYDVLSLPDGHNIPLRVRSIVGLIPLFAVEVIDEALLATVPKFAARLTWFLEHRPDLARLVSYWRDPGMGESRLMSLLRGHRMKCLLRLLLDPNEFLSAYGARSLSRCHKDHPYVFNLQNGQQVQVDYEPAESRTGLFGGNSNWRGPIWMPMNFLLIESLRTFHRYYGDEFRVECPVGSGKMVSIREAADELSRRLIDIFRRDASGKRAVLGNCSESLSSAYFCDYIQFHEYFDGDTGQGLGASHQTGWTGLVAAIIAGL